MKGKTLSNMLPILGLVLTLVGSLIGLAGTVGAQSPDGITITTLQTPPYQVTSDGEGFDLVPIEGFDRFGAPDDPELRKVYNRDEIPVTRWVSPDDSQPITFDEWQALQPPAAPLYLQRVYPSEALPPNLDQMVVLVNPSVYDGISASLDQWASDVESTGGNVVIYCGSFPDPPTLRSYLAGIVELDGCLLIGDFPVPWYEIDNQPSGFPSYEQFPIDLYYMDLDGIWSDSDLNGLYDDHTGNVAPEIWVGRLTASNLTFGGDEVALLNNYLAKNHAYRTGSLLLPSRALMYVDDDWEYWASSWGQDLGLVYTDTTVISDPETTRAVDYSNRLLNNYEWIQVCAHSWPGGHSFKYNGGGNWDHIYNYEIYGIDPHAFFYDLFACSAARFVETDYVGGWYVFVDTYGLAAVGSTKTGSMLGFDQFYGPFGQAKLLGEAFRDWFEAVGIYNKAWHYGMTLLGDPTLTIPLPQIESSPPSFEETVHVDEMVTQTLTISNTGSSALEFELYEWPGAFTPLSVEEIIAGSKQATQALPQGHYPNLGKSSSHSVVPLVASLESSPSAIAPVLDGVYNDDEWNDANSVSATLISDPAGSEIGKVYVKHTYDNLYVLVDYHTASGTGVDITGDVWFDLDNNGTDDGGFYSEINGGSLSTAFSYPGTVEVGESATPNNASAHWIFEYEIPLVGLGMAPGATWGVHFVLYDYVSEGGEWDNVSTGFDYLTPSGWADLTLALGDVPWLSEDPISGTVSASASLPVDVIFDATGLAQGDYTADLTIHSNDPHKNLVTVPVVMHVLPWEKKYLPIISKNHP